METPRRNPGQLVGKLREAEWLLGEGHGLTAVVKCAATSLYGVAPCDHRGSLTLPSPTNHEFPEKLDR